MTNASGDAVDAELVSLRRQNEQLSQLVEQAIRMGERLLVPAREAVGAYHDYVNRDAGDREAAERALSRLALVMDELARLVGEAKPTSDDLKPPGRKPRPTNTLDPKTGSSRRR